MAALVPEMAEQRPIGLIELLFLPLALNRVGLHYIDGDHAIEMPGHSVAAEIKCQAAGRCRARVKRKAEPKERVDEPLLGTLEFLPCSEIAVEITGNAEGIRVIRRRQPVACAVNGVSTVGECLAGIPGQPPIDAGNRIGR